MADTHTVMPKKLAQALMDAGMQHFDGGGLIGGISNNLGATNNFKPQDANTGANLSLQQGQQQDVYGQQQALASQLLAQTQGQGPGQQLINAQAGNNQAAMAATEAGVRGASANPALIARNAAVQAQQGNAQNLNAQAALQLQSQQALGGQQAQMANQTLQGQSIDQGALSSLNQIGAGVAGQNAYTNQGIAGGLIGGISQGIGKLFNQGGEVPGYASGGQIMGMQNYGGGIPSYGGGSGGSNQPQPLKTALASMFSSGAPGAPTTTGQASPWEMGGGMAGGPMDSMSNTGPASAGAGLASDAPLLMAASQGGKVPFSQMLAGGNVPGKAPVKGDSKKNDIVPTMLSPGEEVIPRSIAQGKNAPEKAAEFIRHLKKRKK